MYIYIQYTVNLSPLQFSSIQCTYGTWHQIKVVRQDVLLHVEVGCKEKVSYPSYRQDL